MPWDGAAWPISTSSAIFSSCAAARVAIEQQSWIVQRLQLFFVGFQRDPQAQFKVLQTRLGTSDLLGEYIATIGGGLRACPPGVRGPHMVR